MSEASNEEGTTPAQSTHECDIASSLYDVNDAELVKIVEDLQIEIVHLELENQVFENFLLKNDPALITGMAQILELAGKMQYQAQSTLAPISLERRETSDSIRASSRKSDSIVRFTTTTASTGERGPRINLSQKMDLAMREMEEMQIALEKFIQISHRLKCNLKAELEEIAIREAEVNDARLVFEQNVVIEGVDSLTQRIPAEKFIRYMEEWLRSAESTIEKMRLRTSTLKTMYIKLSSQLIQKEELGEAIDAVDFDQLRIQNKHLAEKIDQKNTHLLELKKMNGTANLVLSTNKQYLQKQVLDMKSLQDSIKFKEQKIINLDKDSETVESQVNKEKHKFSKILNMKENYSVPDVMDYVRTKAKLQALKRNCKTLERRNHIQQFALNTCIRQMKNITGIKNPQPSWFEIIEKDSSDSFFLNEYTYDPVENNET